MWALWWLWLLLPDSVAGLRYFIAPHEGGETFGIRLRLERSDRFGWIVLYRCMPYSEIWSEVQKVYVDRWQLPKEYLLQDKLRGEVGWIYRVVWRGTSAGAPEVELGRYLPFGRLPVPPRLSLEKPGSRLLRCVFPEAGEFLMRAYNSYGEEVFTFPIQVSEARTEVYQIPPLCKGRYLIRLVEPRTSLSLAEIVIAL